MRLAACVEAAGTTKPSVAGPAAACAAPRTDTLAICCGPPIGPSACQRSHKIETTATAAARPAPDTTRSHAEALLNPS